MKGYVHMPILSFPAWLRRLGYYGLALALVALGVILRVGLERLVGQGLPTYITFYPMVMLAALLGGWGPGLLAIVATAAVADYWLLPPAGLFKIESMVDLVGLVFFCAMGLFVSVVAELYRHLRGHLEDLVIARTAALSRANEQLQEQARELQRQSQELAELARSLAREKEILQSVMDGAKNSHLVYLDRDFNFVRVNATYAGTCGYTPEQMIGRNHFALYPHAENEAIFARVRDTGVPAEFHDKPFVFPDQPQRGTTYWDWTLIPVTDEAGHVQGLVFSLFETTQRKQAEEALRTASERLQEQAEELQTQAEELHAQTEELTTANEELRERGQALRESEEALRELNTTLESKVAERTEELQHRARQLQKLTLELTETEERERKRLAQILHDDLQQILAAAKFHVSILGSRVKSDATLQKMTVQVDGLLGDAIDKSRRLSHKLSAPVLTDSDLSRAFEWLAQQVQTQHGLAVHLEAGKGIELASEPLRVLLYKAAQELLFNVIKHAGVCEATLRLRHRHGRIRLSVSDRGRGFDPAQADFALGFGLLSIRERIGCLGGRLKIRSAPGKGSTFLIAVPDSDVQEHGSSKMTILPAHPRTRHVRRA